MDRLILVDNASGYIWGDTEPLTYDGSLIDAARQLDYSLGETGRLYNLLHGHIDSNRTGYSIFKVDPRFPSIDDGQDQEMIDRVYEDGIYVGFVACRLAPEDLL